MALRACGRLLVAPLLAAALATGSAGAFAADGAAAPEVRVGAAEALTVGETFTLESRILGETRRINVYRPAAAPPEEPLPVLYMPDGGIDEDLLHVLGLVQISTLNQTMRPVLLVGIENTERRRDLTGPTTIAEDREIAPRVGGSEAYRTFVARELIPTIESRYRTTDERALIGESLAGLFVVETWLLTPDLFDHYIAIDPSLWWNGAKLIERIDDTLGERSVARGSKSSASARPRTSLFLATSDTPSIVEPTERLVALLEEQAPDELTWSYEAMPEEKHWTIYHPAALLALRAHLAPPPASASDSQAATE